MPADEHTAAAYGRAFIVDSLAALELRQTMLAPYDREIGVRLLYEDPETGAEHDLIRYPPGLRSRVHVHTAAHTIVVLEGRLEANDRVIGPGAYAHFPGGEPMRHQAAGDDGCLFVILFDGPFDVAVVAD